MNLRQITIKDQLELKKVYFDSIQSLDEKIYSQEQKRAWSSQAWNNSNFEKSITKGKGWLLSKEGMIIGTAPATSAIACKCSVHHWTFIIFSHIFPFYRFLF